VGEGGGTPGTRPRHGCGWARMLAVTDVDLVAPGPLPAPRTTPAPAALDGTAGPGGAPMHPRPQLTRDGWASLEGAWGYAATDEAQGLGGAGAWARRPTGFDREIVVPFPPESEASGIGERDFHPVVWYRREVTEADVASAGQPGQGSRLLLHFGAVDYRADIWLGARYLGSHEGGHTPFDFDVTEIVTEAGLPLELVVRAEDDPLDVSQPRGKQDWQPTPHGIWYERTTGIWQPVWLEAAPALHVAHVTWRTDLVAASVTLGLELNRRPTTPVEVDVELRFGDDELAAARFRVTEPRSVLVLTLPRQANGQAYQSLLWSPEKPRLVDATIALSGPDDARDTVRSYLGIRSVGWAGGHFLLNERPYYVRAVLAQDYWPASHLAAPDADSLRAEVQLAKDLGFNTMRLHQKVEDPRLLAWADRLGMMLWSETPSAYEFSTTAVARLTREWLDVVRRDASHPSIVTWVPLNESWGVPHMVHDPAQRAFAQHLLHLTKALDPTRPVVSNDGWEHLGSDILTVHDYAVTGPELRSNYVDRAAVEQMLSGVGPLGRRMLLTAPEDRGKPVMLSEFGGVSYAPGHEGPGWGYSAPPDAEEYERVLRELFEAVQSSPVLAGFCYTQLTDTRQEANGLLDEHRRTKLPIPLLRAIITGRPEA
jgi:beta-galactosidase/beta-glucuronidase